MDNLVHMDMSVQEMRNLAEICAMTLSTLEPLKAELQHDARYREWQHLCISILDAARQIPELEPLMEHNPNCAYWFFKPSAVQRSFYALVVTKMQENIFWSEFVTRMADEVFGLHQSTAAEQQQRAMYEQALWDAVERRGLRCVQYVP